MPPDTARTQQAALERVQRLQAKEDKARKRYEQDKTKSDSTLKSLAAKAAKDGAAKKKLEELNGGKGDRKEGTPASGPVQGGKGMGPHKKNPVGDKSTKEAAKWTAKLAAASKKSQLPPEVPGANEAPQVATDGGKGAEGGGAGAAAGGGGGGGGGAAGAAADGGGGGAGSTQKAKELTNAPPSEYAVKISETGKKITDEAKSEISAKNEAMPVFSAEMKGEDAKEKKGGKLNGLDTSMGTGVDGADAAAPNLKKEARIRTGKGKPGSDIKGAGSDAETEALKSLFSASLNKISDHSSTNTSPGPSPTVQFGGKSDPMRGNRAQEEAIQKQDAAYVEAVKAVDSGPGPEQVQPLELKEDIPAANAELPPIPDVPTPAEAQAYIDKGHASDVYDKADELQKSNFDEALAEAESQFEQAGDQMNADHATKVDEASKAVDEENKKAQAEQEAQVTKARADIDKGQKDTKKKQEKELVKAKRKGDKEKKAVQGKIEKRRKDDDKKINKKYREAEKKAAAKKKAAEKKKSDESWWSRAASAVGSFIDSVANAVSGIFDAMAKAVGDILNKVKDLATSMIDAAISFASSALDILGDKLKGLVDSLLGDIFPGLAAALNELIDQAVNIAKDAVNAVGEQLKAVVTAAIDNLNSGIQAVINAYKTAVTTALAIASAVASGDWEAAFKAMLEGALSLAGIDPSAFYGLVGDGMDTINAIIDDPMSFVSNMIGAVGQGFGQFADNFGSHLMNGAVEWLTGGLAEAGITLPETWDAAGIFGMIADILGVSFDKLKDKIGERIGEDNVAMLESIWGYVEAAMNGGIAGLWEHAKGQLGDLWAGLLDSAITMLTEQIITAAVMKIATMWNPAGAIVQALITVWNVYNFIQEQAQRIMGLVRSVVDSMSNIVQGQLGQAANFIEGSLADLVPVAISLLANLLGLGGISKKVKGIIEEIQAQVDKAIDWVLDKLFELGKAAFEALKSTMKGGGNEDPAAEQKAAEEQQPEQPVGGDPAQLPRLTLATTQGAMPLDWDAERGGQGAAAKLTAGPYSGKLGAEGIGKLEAAAGALEGSAKTEAEKYIGNAKMSVLSVDSRAGKFIRGEETDLKRLKDAFDTLGALLLEGVSVLGSANDSGLDGGAFPKEAKFNDAHGHSHRLWAEADNGQAKIMVASTPIRVQDQVKAWNPLVAKMTQPDKGKAEALIAQAIQLEQEADDIADKIAASLAEAGALTAKQAALAPVLEDIFSITSKSGELAGLDPRETLISSEFMDFETRFVDFGKDVGLANTAAEAERIWLQAIMTIQQTDDSFQKIKKLTPETYRVELSGKAMAAVIKEFDPLIDELRPTMDAWVSKYKGKKWAFWSGKPAQAVATNAPGWNALESSALGGLFDGLNLDGRWNTQLWGALSKAYAEYLAKSVGDAGGFGGFVGMESTGVENIYKAIEQKAVVRILGKTEAAKLEWTWYSCISLASDLYKPDTTQEVDGVPGTFLKTKDRDKAIAEAEDKNRTLHGKGDKPHGNLLAHLQANNDASAAFDGNLMSKLETSTAPDDPNKKLPAMEDYLFHQRPTLKTLFIDNSNVGKALTDDLEKIEVDVTHGTHTEKRDFKGDSPYKEPLKEAVKGDLSGTVRSPTIKETVLQRANPAIPAGAKGAIEGWLRSQEAQATPEPELPPATTFSAAGESHRVFTQKDGDGASVIVASDPLPWAERVKLWKKEMNNLTDACSAIAQGLITRATPIAEDIEEMTRNNAPSGLIQQKQDLLRPILQELFKHVPSDPELHAQRVEYERKMGVKLTRNGQALAAALDMAKAANAYLESRATLWTDSFEAMQDKLEKLYEQIGTDKAGQWTGRAGKDAEVVKRILTTKTTGSSLAERIVHAENVHRIMVNDYLENDIDTFHEVMRTAGLHSGTMEEHANTVLDRWNDANPLDQKGKDDLVAFAATGKPGLMGEFDSVTMIAQNGMRKKRIANPGAVKADGSWSELTKEDFEKYGGKFSPTEKTLTSQKGNDFVPWCEGKLEWVSDTTSRLAQEYNKSSVPMGAGLSGSTHRLFIEARNFGMGGRGGEIRLIAAAFLLALHHSFQEIMVAAAGAPGGVPYSGDADYAQLDPPGPAWMKQQVGPIPGDVPSS